MTRLHLPRPRPSVLDALAPLLGVVIGLLYGVVVLVAVCAIVGRVL